MKQPRFSPLTRALSATSAAVLAGAALVGCSTDSASGGDGVEGAGGADPASVVATTKVWADVASAVTGTDVNAIISDASLDPHYFEPNAKDLTRLKQAGTVVANGGHYDAALYTVAEQDRVIHAVPLQNHGAEEEHDHSHSDHEHDHEHDHDGHDHGDHSTAGLPQDIDQLEHVWMAPSKVKDVAAQVEERVGGDAGSVEKRMGAIEDRLAALPHVHVAMTETIGAPLIWGTELHDLTPEEYSRAALNHSEPSVSAVADFIEQIESGDLDLLIVNPQSSNNATDRLVKAAEENNVPIVEIRETPPEGTNFLDYFEQVVGDIAAIAEKAEPQPETEIDSRVG
ncbi:zinc ABC transporter substrate-binding protein [Corynebacterium sp. CCUG 69979]|uniref:metal ABC transporter solute-binding protein, Zn/Mn family n=1 Tax=Corynebacterium sp. CCUG 69979 TaxID=2823890 RepID=UPI002108CD64|nr:zinc ABC transporter substrate-binding protein [Corynebacterium sp. CCUG 69979]MCQ4625410.1 zinc ABC transporter substrate-binding protein [Corynebacterium sp. CCUG 69979]